MFGCIIDEVNTKNGEKYAIQRVKIIDCFTMQVEFKPGAALPGSTSIEDLIPLLQGFQHSLAVDDGHPYDFTMHLDDTCFNVKGNIRSCLLLLFDISFLSKETTLKIIDNIEYRLLQIKTKNNTAMIMLYQRNFHYDLVGGVNPKENDFSPLIIEEKIKPNITLTLSGMFLARLLIESETDAIALFDEIKMLDNFTIERVGFYIYVHGQELKDFFNYLCKNQTISQDTFDTLSAKLENYALTFTSHLIAPPTDLTADTTLESNSCGFSSHNFSSSPPALIC